MTLFTFHKVGPAEYTGWHRGNNYVVTQRGDRWLLALNSKVLERFNTRGLATEAALIYADTHKNDRSYARR